MAMCLNSSLVAQTFLLKSVSESSGLHLRISETPLRRKDSTDRESCLAQDSTAETYLGALHVEAFPSLPSKELLVIYFESKRTSGGKIEELILNDNGQSATIVFKDPKGTCMLFLSCYLSLSGLMATASCRPHRLV